MTDELKKLLEECKAQLRGTAIWLLAIQVFIVLASILFWYCS
jgi:hypothetical protein